MTKKRKIVYLDNAGRKKETDPLSSAEEIEFFKRVKERAYTVIRTINV